MTRRVVSRTVRPASSGGVTGPELITSWGTLYNPNSKLSGGNVDSGTGLVTLTIANVAGIGLGYGAANASRYSQALATWLPSYNTSTDGLCVHLSSLSIPNRGERVGIAVFLTDADDNSGTGGGGIVLQDQTVGTNYAGENDATTNSVANLGATTPTDAQIRFECLPDGDLSVDWSVKISGAWTRVLSARESIGWSARPNASDLRIQLAATFAVSTAPTAGDTLTAAVSVSSYTLPQP